MNDRIDLLGTARNPLSFLWGMLGYVLRFLWLFVFLTSNGPWGRAPKWRKPLPWELPEWEMVDPDDRLSERSDPHEAELCEIRLATEAARGLPMGWPTVEMGTLPSTNGLSSPDILGLVESARAFGTDEYFRCPDGFFFGFFLLLALFPIGTSCHDAPQSSHSTSVCFRRSM